MTFSHGLASAIWLLLPLAPSFGVAATMTILRSYLAYMDNPLRSSFIMGVVPLVFASGAEDDTKLTALVLK